jgi:glycosyltransferase involved in cell wall biosynthesis
VVDNLKITLLSHNLSSNSFQRIYPIYLVLQRHFDVEIVGPYFGKGLFSPYEGMIPYKGIRGSSYPGFLFKIKRLLSLIEGDIVYVFKPMATSFGIALLKTLGSRQPIVLDIEDWDLGEWIQTWQEEEPLTILRWILHDLRFPQSAVLAWPFEKLVPLADAITVGTRFLEQRFGGHYLPPCVDVHDFDPKRYNRKAARQKWRINEREKIILFSGTPRPHKGLDELIEAAGAADSIAASPIRIVLDTFHRLSASRRYARASSFGRLDSPGPERYHCRSCPDARQTIRSDGYGETHCRHQALGPARDLAGLWRDC